MSIDAAQLNEILQSLAGAIRTAVEQGSHNAGNSENFTMTPRFAMPNYKSGEEITVKDYFTRMLIEQMLFGMQSRNICDEVIAKMPTTFADAYEAAYSRELLLHSVSTVNDKKVPEVELTFTAAAISRETKKVDHLGRILQALESGRCLSGSGFKTPETKYNLSSGCLIFEHRVVIPFKLQQRVLDELHRAHLGVVKMKSIARSFVYWPGIDKDIENTAQTCDFCARNASLPPKCSDHHWEYPKGPWERIHIDYAGPMEGMMLLIISDAYSKWLEVKVTKSTTASATIMLLDEVFTSYGVPLMVVSDNGTNFTSAELNNYLDSVGVKYRKFSAPYHPATNGQAERNVQTVKNALRAMGSNAKTLKSNLNEFLRQYRNAPHSTTAPEQNLNGSNNNDDSVMNEENEQSGAYQTPLALRTEVPGSPQGSSTPMALQTENGPEIHKILLINEVEKRPILWDLTDRKHFDAVCIKNAWKSVAETLNRSEDECKVAWKSLRDSYRYHCKVAGKKSGSAGGVGPQQPRANDAVEWHLAPYMSFLPEMSSQRRSGINLCASQCSLDLDESNSSFNSLIEFDSNQLDADASTSCGESSYSYSRNVKKRKLEQPTPESDKVIGVLARSIVRYWDERLNEMSQEEAEAAEQEMTQVLWKHTNAAKKKKKE
ncbi:hypothetical protein ACLKA7_007855 [Drosophila subpalustris]